MIEFTNNKMSYIKEARGLSQSQAIENLRAVLSSDYFKDYEFCIDGGQLRSDMISVDSIGGYKKGKIEMYKAGELSDTVLALLNAVENTGTLDHVFICLAPSEEILRAMNFEERVYDDLRLPLTFGIAIEGRNEQTYCFSVTNYGLKQSHFEDHGLNFKDAKKKLALWYAEITINLKKILPHQVNNSIY